MFQNPMETPESHGNSPKLPHCFEKKHPWMKAIHDLLDETLTKGDPDSSQQNPVVSPKA